MVFYKIICTHFFSSRYAIIAGSKEHQTTGRIMNLNRSEELVEALPDSQPLPREALGKDEFTLGNLFAESSSRQRAVGKTSTGKGFFTESPSRQNIYRE